MKLKNRVVSVPVVSNLATDAERAGFDSIEWDVESCMTLSQFVSRLNKRTDEYGGKIENRIRIVMEIYEGTRKALGKGFILGARINGDDLVMGGNTLLHSTEIAKRFAAAGMDYLSISCGGQWTDALPPKPGEPPSAYTGYSGLRCWPTSTQGPLLTHVNLTNGSTIFRRISESAVKP